MSGVFEGIPNEKISEIFAVIVTKCVAPYAATGGRDFAQIEETCIRHVVEELMKINWSANDLKTTARARAIVRDFRNNFGMQLRDNPEWFVSYASKSSAELSRDVRDLSKVVIGEVLDRCTDEILKNRNAVLSYDSMILDRWLDKTIDQKLREICGNSPLQQQLNSQSNNNEVFKSNIRPLLIEFIEMVSGRA